MLYSSLVVLALLGVAHAIYPENHWQHSTKLTVANFDDEIKKAVDSGKTMMVRWIASEGWGWWRKQAPAWNTISERYASNPDIVFGDVNLSEEQVRGNHNPGAGGWPTIKYFNKETGYEGAPYEKKTTKSMCDELGDNSYMEDYVVEAAGLTLCDVVTGEGCSDKEKTFAEKYSSKSSADVKAQLARLNGMNAKKMTPDLAAWMKQRKAILKSLLKNAGEEL